VAATAGVPVTRAPSARRSHGTAIAAAVTAAVVLAILARFHDQFWYPPDEGNYAHVAERLLDGERLFRDVQDIHGGYIDFVNAGAMALFGRRLVSLRYPLVLVSLVQSLIVVWLLRRRGPALAAPGGIASVCTGVLLFLCPSANWYALLLIVGSMAVLSGGGGWIRRAFWCGVMCGGAFLFRQLTGVILAMGVVTWLSLAPADGAPPAGRAASARLALVVILLGVIGYTVRSADAVSWILFGAAPLVVTLAALRETRVPDGEWWRRIGGLAAGVLVAAAPLAAYLTHVGAWRAFLDDVFLSAAGLPRMEMFDDRSYGYYLVVSVLGLGTLRPAVELASAFWLTSVTAALVLAYRAGRALLRGRALAELGPLVVIGAFAGLLAVHYVSALYVGAGLPAVLVGSIALSGRGRRATWAWCGLLTVLCLGSLLGQAAQRRASNFMWGLVHERNVPVRLERAGLRVEPGSARFYEHLVALVQRESRPGEPIFALPSHAEIYFLADRPNPTRFYSLPQAVRNGQDAAELVRVLEKSRPRVVLFDPGDLLNTPAANGVIRWTVRVAESRQRIGPFWLFTLPRSGATVAHNSTRLSAAVRQ
jgi:hypothetical protein